MTVNTGQNAIPKNAGNVVGMCVALSLATIYKSIKLVVMYYV